MKSEGRQKINASLITYSQKKGDESIQRKDSKDMKESKNKNFTSKIIMIGVSSTILFFESIIILLSFFRKGFRKKEVLSKDSKLGFDIIIKF
tara:strand:- start:194 stop:469 length:276 start_codon:yes stop_codon:yes gene_type:complete